MKVNLHRRLHLLLLLLLLVVVNPSYQQSPEVKCDTCYVTPSPPPPSPPPPVVLCPPPPSPPYVPKYSPPPPPPDVPKYSPPPPPDVPKYSPPPPPNPPCGPCDITIAPPGTLYPVDPSFFPGSAAGRRSWTVRWAAPLLGLLVGILHV